LPSRPEFFLARPVIPDTVDPVMGTFPGRMLLGALAVVASVVTVLMNVGTRPTPATAGTGAAVSSHVVIVGLSGLRWADVSPSETPALWQLALACLAP